MQNGFFVAPDGASPGVMEIPATRIGNMHDQQISVKSFPLNSPASLQTNASVVIPSAFEKENGTNKKINEKNIFLRIFIGYT